MSRSLFTPSELPFVRALSRLVLANPFLRERMDAEREALGNDAHDHQAFWVPESAAAELDGTEFLRPNLQALKERSWDLACAARKRLVHHRDEISEVELGYYHNLGLYGLFSRYEDEFYALCCKQERKPSRAAFYPQFATEYVHLFAIDGIAWPDEGSSETAFALLFQLRRAFHYIFRYLLGSSEASARLRSEIWNSIFTHDLGRYRRGLYRRMHDIPTLILGPTGSGKDLVAQALGYCRFIPFDEKTQRFADAFHTQFLPIHLAALPLSLIESELFGHRRGAFTSALEDRVGWLESCGPSGAVFLDEVGELPGEVQIKLLRVLQARSFSRLGETETRLFLGKIVAATHRDLDHEIAQGRFREDLYHRLGADCLRTPSLRERLDSDPAELSYLVQQLSLRVAGPSIASDLTDDCLRFIRQHIGSAYPWPGNIRELEQCVRSVLVRGRYEVRVMSISSPSSLGRLLLDSRMSLQALCQTYVKLTFENCGNYVETGRRLGIDRRTVKEHLRVPETTSAPTEV